MRRGSGRRRRVLETVVFAAALLMTAFLARELWRRRPVGRFTTASGGGPLSNGFGSGISSPYGSVTLPRLNGAVALNPERPGPPLAGRATERAVTAAPPLRLKRVERRKPQPAAVPAPR